MQNFWFKIREAGQGHFHRVARQQASWLLFLYLVAGMASVWAQAGSSAHLAETIVAGMAQARAEGRARLRPSYRHEELQAVWQGCGQVQVRGDCQYRLRSSGLQEVQHSGDEWERTRTNPCPPHAGG